MAALALLIAIAALIAWRVGIFELRDPEKLQQASDQAQDIPWIGPIFVVTYGLLAALALPISPLAIMAGVIFGFAKGALFVWLASVLGASGGYWLARLVGGQFLRGLLRKHHEALDQLKNTRHAFWPVLRLQLLPIAPFGLVNAASAAAGISFVSFIAATALGVVPGTVAYVFLGDRLRAGLGGSQQHAVLWSSVVGIALVALSFVPTLVQKRKARRAPVAQP